ncbi:MAG: cytochrome P450 [Elainellaceae cyanobacterium]
MTSSIASVRRTPPGPKGHFLVGILPEYSRSPIGFFTDCARQYGDIVYLTGGINTYLLNHPDYIEETLVSQQVHLVKSQINKLLKPILGNGLLLSEGDFWKQQRRLIQPAFHRDRIASYTEVMVNYTEQLLSTWQAGEIRDVHHDMMQLTLAIVIKTFFDSQLQDEVAMVDRSTKIFLDHFDRRSTNLLWFLLPDAVPIPANLRFRQAIHQLDQMVYRLIQDRRHSQQNTGDLLSMLLHLQAEDGTCMSDRQVRDEVMTFILAGHETTAVALSWAWFLLATHPHVEEKLQAELQAVLAGRSPTWADLPKLRYTEWIILEAMRLYPPVWALARTVASDCEIAGYSVKAGSDVVASQWVVQRDPRWFPEPEAFNPDRWANDLAKRLPPYTYFPFGGGSRICIGKAFAMMEASLILATIAQRYQMTLVEPEAIEPRASVSLRPKQGVKVRLIDLGSI